LLRWAAFCIFYLVEEFSRWWCSRRRSGRSSWRPLAAHTVRFTFHTRSCVSALRRITRHERPMGEFASNVRPEILYQRALRGQERRGYDLQRDGLPPTSPIHGAYLFVRQHIATDYSERVSDRGPFVQKPSGDFVSKGVLRPGTREVMISSVMRCRPHSFFMGHTSMQMWAHFFMQIVGTTCDDEKTTRDHAKTGHNFLGSSFQE
jgi:hypothetical protein